MSKLPEHLGGHCNKTHTDRATLVHLKTKYNVRSMIDVGCGPGDMVELAGDRGIDCVGIDGDFTLREGWQRRGLNVILHDFSKGKPELQSTFDLGWSVEFLEHVDEEYVPNFMSVFERCSYVVCTAAPPGWPGHHHVNCRPQEYWHGVFSEYGFEYDNDETLYIRENSAMRKPFMQQNGMFFRKVK